MIDSVQKLGHFFESQLAEWSLPQKNFSDLESCITKEFRVKGSPVAVQFNPARMVSTAAKVDTKSIAERKCFLCRENRPIEQQDFHFNDEYSILVNPFPIFPRHFTIPKKSHTPQIISGELSAMYDLTKIFGAEYSVFYNGPRCGASAPDHHHFQMGSSGFMPIESERNPNPSFSATMNKNGFDINFINDGLRSYLEFRLADINSSELFISTMEQFLNFYSLFTEETLEPMLNIISYKELKSGNIVFLFMLRSKHRPDRYFSSGQDHMIISPASVDVGGKIITPRKEDFERITDKDIAEIFEEVFIPQSQLESLFKEYLQFTKTKNPVQS